MKLNLIGKHDLTLNQFLSKKPGPASFERNFMMPGGALKTKITVSEGKKVNYKFSYEGNYSYEEAASDNGENFKQWIEKSVIGCKCSFTADSNPPEEDDPMSEESTLDFSCVCPSKINCLFTSDVFSSIDNEVNEIALKMREKAFKYERTAY